MKILEISKENMGGIIDSISQVSLIIISSQFDSPVIIFTKKITKLEISKEEISKWDEAKEGAIKSGVIMSVVGMILALGGTSEYHDDMGASQVFSTTLAGGFILGLPSAIIGGSIAAASAENRWETINTVKD